MCVSMYVQGSPGRWLLYPFHGGNKGSKPVGDAKSNQCVSPHRFGGGAGSLRGSSPGGRVVPMLFRIADNGEACSRCPTFRLHPCCVDLHTNLGQMDSSIESPDHPGRSSSPPQQPLQQVCGRSSKTARGPTQQLQIEGLIGGLERFDRIGDILRTTGKALHGDKVLSPNHTQGTAAKGHGDRARQSQSVEPAQARQQIHPIVMPVAYREQRGNGIIRIPATQLRRKSRFLEYFFELPELGNGNG